MQSRKKRLSDRGKRLSESHETNQSSQDANNINKGNQERPTDSPLSTSDIKGKTKGASRSKDAVKSSVILAKNRGEGSETKDSFDILTVDRNPVYDWSFTNAGQVMTAGVCATLDEQNVANAIVWYNTLFSPGKNPGDKNYIPLEETILQDQQALLMRYFFSLASLGIWGGDQDKNIYAPLDTFVNQDGDRVGLATVASGGGLFNFRSSDGSGKAFQDFLYGINNSDHYLGAYTRPATHGNVFTSDGKILEQNYTGHGEKGWTGINIPIGGIGQRLKTVNKTEAVTGYQGKSQDDKGIFPKKYQTGSILFNHYQEGQLSNTLMGFEGSAPNEDNIHGGSHGVIATVGKKIFKESSDKTLTGQGKRSGWGVENKGLKVTGEGGRIALVSQENLRTLNKQWSAFQNKSAQDQQVFFKKLLLTTTQRQRDDLFNELTQIFSPLPPLPQNPTSQIPFGNKSQPPISDFFPPLPSLPSLLDLEQGVLLKNAKRLFRDAYRRDIRKGAYLTEAEGHIAANAMKIKVSVYNQMPPGFCRAYNPGNGDCLLYSLLQAKAYDETQKVLKEENDLDYLTAIIAENNYRKTISEQISNKDIDQLTAAALAAEIDGHPEPGLGRLVQGLLGNPDVAAYRDRRNSQIEKQASQQQTDSLSDKEKDKQDTVPVVIDPGSSSGKTKSSHFSSHSLLDLPCWL